MTESELRVIEESKEFKLEAGEIDGGGE